MKFTTGAAVEQLVWEMRLADYPRALNRAQMNALANGAPPYTDQEQRQNNINTNVNFLDYTALLVDARRLLEGRVETGSLSVALYIFQKRRLIRTALNGGRNPVGVGFHSAT